ncbi:vesicle coat component [Modicella reniformis]|uniref:Vesicle coat component n=1 Tax=Modicella reniformis TaxID=1440133 RepID=A0A9P6STN0_9FUNG|nr:vesicle coat component [Modicella reniformis]
MPHFTSAAPGIALLFLAIVLLLAPAQAIKFELAGETASEVVPFCVSHYVDDETNVVVKAKVGPGVHQKTSLENLNQVGTESADDVSANDVLEYLGHQKITDDSEHQNQLWRKNALSEELQRATFLTKQAGDIVACFTNVLADGYQPDPRYTRTVDIDFDIGAETIDYDKLAEQEKLKPMEVELRKLEDLVKEILENMEHLKAREEKMRNTNGKISGLRNG